MSDIKQLGLVIKGLCPGLPEVGKIKIGMKGRTITSKQGNQFQPPQKLDHFRITTLQRGQDGNYLVDSSIHKIIGEKPTRIKVRLLYDDPELNFPTRLTCYNGASLWCVGNNEIAFRSDGNTKKEVPCPCERVSPEFNGRGKCKYNGVLSVILEDYQRIGGVWKLRTTSYNSVVNILSSMAMIQRITGGKLAGIPLELSVLPKTVNTPVTGQVQTIYVVGLEYRGSMLQLAEEGAKHAIAMAEQHEKIRRVEEYAKLELLSHESIDDTDDQEIVEEFYPENISGCSNEEPETEYSLDDHFNSMLPESYDVESLERFMSQTASANYKEIKDVKRSAVKNWDAFWNAFVMWHDRQNPSPPNDTEEDPPTNDLQANFVHTILSRGITDDQIERVFEFVSILAIDNESTSDGIMNDALKDPAGFVYDFKKWLDSASMPSDPAPNMDIRDIALECQEKNKIKFDAILKSLARAEHWKNTSIESLSVQQLEAIVAEFNGSEKF